MFWGSKGREGLLFPLVDTCFGGSRGNFEGLLLLYEVARYNHVWGEQGKGQELGLLFPIPNRCMFWGE